MRFRVVDTHFSKQDCYCPRSFWLVRLAAECSASWTWPCSDAINTTVTGNSKSKQSARASNVCSNTMFDRMCCCKTFDAWALRMRKPMRGLSQNSGLQCAPSRKCRSPCISQLNPFEIAYQTVLCFNLMGHLDRQGHSDCLTTWELQYPSNWANVVTR